MLRSVFVAAAAAVLLAVGALSAMAGNSHAKSTNTLATSSTLRGEATGDQKSEATPATAATPAATPAQTETQAQAETDTDTDTETADEANDEDANDATDETKDDQAPAALATTPAANTQKEDTGQDD
jgi:hypothetical protein